MYSVYALTDPRDETIRYIGMSKNVWRRYAMHLLVPSKGTQAKNAWIEELRNIDLSPLLKILETAETEEEAGKKETRWIRYFLDLNAPLVNVAKTGNTAPYQRSLVDLSPALAVEGEFLTIEEIASASEVSTDVVLKYLKQKKLVGFKVAGAWRITRQDFLKFVDTQRKEQQTEE